jgi:hypothetical protein
VLGPAQHRAGETLAQHLPITETKDGHHLAGIHRLRRSNRNALPAKRFNEANQVTRQAVRGERLAGANAANGHWYRLVQPKLAGGALLI